MEANVIDRSLTRTARWLGVAGVASVVFGVTLLLWPGMSLVALTALFGAYALVYGTFALGAGLSMVAHKSTNWAPFVIGGAAGILFGVVTFLAPAATDLTLAYLIAGWSFVLGVFEIMASIDMWGEIKDAIWFGISGVLSIAFGVVVAWRPGVGLLAMLWLMGVYAIIAGAAQLYGSYRVHQFHTAVKSTVGAMRPSGI